MLDHHETRQLAEAHLRTHEADLRARNARIRLELVTLCELDDPPGVYYSSRVVEPPGDILLGGGGFFVDRRDGAIREFGSGDVVEACRALNPKHPLIPDMQITPPVVRFLLSLDSQPLDEMPSKRWWQF